MCEWSYDDVMYVLNVVTVHTYIRRRYLVSCVDAYYNHVMCTCVYCGSILYVVQYVHVKET